MMFLLLADYTLNLAVDYVMYPAIVGIAGLVITILVKVGRRIDLDKAMPLVWGPMFVVALSGFGFAIGDMPKSHSIPDPPEISKYGNDDKRNELQAQVTKTHYEYLDKHPPTGTVQEPRLLPRWADGTILVGSIGLLLCSLVSFGVWIDKYNTKGA